MKNESDISQTVAKPLQFGQLEDSSKAGEPVKIDLLRDVPLTVTAELGRTRMIVRDILKLGVGSVVELEKLTGEPIDILVNGKIIARGEVVAVDENFGVRVTEVIGK